MRKSAEAIVARTPGESREERRAEDERTELSEQLEIIDA
jgi:hypothetical protein